MKPSLVTEPTDERDGPKRRNTAEAERISALYETYGPVIYRLAYRLTGSVEDAEDVVQEVFLGLPDSLARYREMGKLDGWMRTVGARVALAKLRSRSRKKEVAFDEESLRLPSSCAEDGIEWIDVQRALAALPEALRSVLVLKELEGYSHEEIGAILGIRPAASKVRLHRARKALRNLLRSES